MTGRPRKKKGGGDAEGLRWLTTYGDMVTLLLAFFVLLYAISQVDQQKFQMFVSGLEVPFGNPSAGGSLLDADSGLTSQLGEGPLPADPNIHNVDQGLGLIDGGTENLTPTTTAPPPQTTTTTEPSTTTTTRPLPDDAFIRTAEDLQRLLDELMGNLADAGMGDYVDIEIGTRGLVIAIATDDVLFASGSTMVSVEGGEIIRVIGSSISLIGNDIMVEGHTDDVPLLRPGYDNWNLSTDRAVAVLHMLRDLFDIAPGRLVATGYGEFRPRADNGTPEGRSLNRRVELVIVAETE